MKYFFGFLASIGLVVLVVVLLIRGLTGGNGTPKTQVKLADYANTNAQVSMTIDGKINSNETHRAAEITVSRSEVRMEVFKGYQRELLASKTYQNNDEAYANFLRALQLAGFTKGKADVTAEQGDPRGVCPDGQRYVLKLSSGPSDVLRYWATSCGGQGTFKGSLSHVRQLFTAQVPDYSKLLSGSPL
jgi:hypothetical protein